MRRVMLVVMALALATPSVAEGHMPHSKNVNVRHHHAETALMWLHKRQHKVPASQYRKSYRSHEWLFFHTFDALGMLDPFTCIHRKEGAWNSNTGNGFYGGLQMDWSFQSTYGPEYMDLWGTANNWPVWAQLEAGYLAVISGRGFGPWPNTRKGCA